MIEDEVFEDAVFEDVADDADPGAYPDDSETEEQIDAEVDEVDARGMGHPAVDAAVRAVANASALPVAEQLAAYEGAHETLREVLASIED